MIRLVVKAAIACSGLVLLLAAAAEPPHVVGKSLKDARILLISAGWRPRETSLKFRGDGTLEKSFGNARDLVALGYVEVETCSDTGLNYCFLNYRSTAGCLRLETQGERDPLVIKQSAECPSAEAVDSPTSPRFQ